MAAPASGKHCLKKTLANGGPSTHGPIAAGLKCAPIVIIAKDDARSWNLPLPELAAVSP